MGHGAKIRAALALVLFLEDRGHQLFLLKSAGLCLPKDGYLFIGHSETLARKTHGFKYTQPAVYQK